MRAFRPINMFALVAALTTAGVAGSVQACTGIIVRAKDGAIVAARTLEFESVDPKLIIIPRKQQYHGTAPGNREGLAWVTKYGVVGINGLNLPHPFEGINEKGLNAGLFYFPGSAGYQDVTDANRDRALAPWELATYLLTTCATVEEAKAAIGQVVIGKTVNPIMGIVPPVHFTVHDSTGACIVVEYVDGACKVYDNPVGVITNSPTFDWHMTNLRNYVNLTPTNVPPMTVDGVTFAPFGQGSGLHGLPGDFTPPSRFVRAFALTSSLVPSESASNAVDQSFHVLNQFDIPRGVIRGADSTAEQDEVTLWTSASDMKNRRFYYHTIDDRTVRMIELEKLPLDGPLIRTLPLDPNRSSIVNLTESLSRPAEPVVSETR